MLPSNRIRQFPRRSSSDWSAYHDFAVKNNSLGPGEYRAVAKQFAARTKNAPMLEDIGLLEAAAENGTWIELNAAPKRLDLDWRWWPLAKEKGVRCVINPDAHRVSRLQDLRFGIGAARKGWLRKEDVVNCLPLAKIETALKAKRRSGGVVE